MRLNKRVVDTLTCPEGQHDRLVFDDACRGLALRVTMAGAKIFLFQYRHNGRIRRLRIGSAVDVSLAEARAAADANRREVAAGGDPVAARKAASAAAAEEAASAALTFTALAAQWAQRGLMDRRERYRAEALRALRVNFDGFAALPAAELTVRKVQAALDRMAHDRGLAMARRSRAYGRAMYGWAVKRQLVPLNPFAAVAVEGREIARERVLSDLELGEVWIASGKLGWPFGAFVRLLLLTLQREAEVASMRWSELADDRLVWELPAERAKNGRANLVHLAPLARQVLAGIPRMADCPLIFSTTGHSPISGFSRAKQRLDAEIGTLRSAMAAASPDAQPVPLVPWRFHDLRRTGVTTLARLGVAWQVADRVLNHVTGAIGGVARIYQKHDFAREREAALELWAAHIEAVAGMVDGDFPDD